MGGNSTIEHAFLEAFGTLEEWNDYLEEREDVAFSLVEGVDVAGAEARLRAYTQDNADSIAKYQAQRAEEEAGDDDGAAAAAAAMRRRGASRALPGRGPIVVYSRPRFSRTRQSRGRRRARRAARRRASA